MGRMKELWEQKRQESKHLGGLHNKKDPLTLGLEMSFPCWRDMIHQAHDHNELNRVVDLVFSLEVDIATV